MKSDHQEQILVSAPEDHFSHLDSDKLSEQQNIVLQSISISLMYLVNSIWKLNQLKLIVYSLEVTFFISDINKKTNTVKGKYLYTAKS